MEIVFSFYLDFQTFTTKNSTQLAFKEGKLNTMTFVQVCWRIYANLCIFCILQNIAHISINNIYLQKMLHKLQKETTFNKIKEIYVCILDELMNNLHLFIPQFFELGETLTGLIHALVQTRREEILHVHYMTTPKHKNPCPGNHEIYNFGRLFFGHHYNTFTLSGLCPSGEKKTLKRNNSFHYMNCLATTQHKNPCFWGHTI